MPQLDKFTYFTQFFWSCLLLLTFYIAICNDGDGVLGISRILKLRNQLVSHRGGGSKRLQRRIDLKRSTSSMGIVERIEYDPNRSSRIAPVRWITEVMQRLVFFMVFPFFWDCLFKGHPFLGSIFGVARNALIKCFLQMIGAVILGYGSDCWDLSFHVLPGGGGHPDSAEAPLEGVPVEYRPRRESEFEEDFLRVGTKIQLSHPELPLDKVAELATKTVSLENQISQEVQDLLLQKNYPLPTIGAIKEILCQKDGKDLSPQTLQRILKELKFPGVQSKSFQKLLHEMHIG